MLNWQGRYIDELVEIRQDARKFGNYILSDDIRNYLDTKMVFVFDTPDGQEVYHLPDNYFRFKDKRADTKLMTNRQYLEFRIRQDIKSEKLFDAWLYSVKSSINGQRKHNRTTKD